MKRFAGLGTHRPRRYRYATKAVPLDNIPILEQGGQNHLEMLGNAGDKSRGDLKAFSSPEVSSTSFPWAQSSRHLLLLYDQRLILQEDWSNASIPIWYFLALGDFIETVEMARDVLCKVYSFPAWGVCQRDNSGSITWRAAGKTVWQNFLGFTPQPMTKNAGDRSQKLWVFVGEFFKWEWQPCPQAIGRGYWSSHKKGMSSLQHGIHRH